MNRNIVKPLVTAAWSLLSPLLACSPGADPQVASVTAEAKKPPPPTPLQVPLNPRLIPKFVNQLPVPLASAGPALEAVDLRGEPGVDSRTLRLRMCEFESAILPPGTPLAPGSNGTWTWGYTQESCGDARAKVHDSYIGPIVLASRGVPVDVTFVNDLGNSGTTHVLAWKLGTDQTLHWADPLGLAEEHHCGGHDGDGMGAMSEPDPFCFTHYDGPIPAVPHLHGGEVPSWVDGGPEQWFTSDGAHHGADYYTADASKGANAAVYPYPNVQEPAPLWFHDHTLGATRLNVYAGLAGGWVLEDKDVAELPLPIPLVIQDRMFDTQGQLLFQAGFSGGILWALNAEHPFWNPEFVGDTIVVNGKAWPNLDVEQRRYRFLLLNGSNARTYELFLADRFTSARGPQFWVVATDGGFLDKPVAATKLVVMPGERYEVIVDFAGTPAGTKLLLKNTAKTPFPAGAAPDGATVAQIMQFSVGACASSACPDTSFDPAASNAAVRKPGKEMVRLVDAVTGSTAAGVAPALVRQLTLNEVMNMMPSTVSTDVYDEYFTNAAGVTAAYPSGPLEVLVNNSKWGADPSEKPKEGATEIWEIVNLTADAHPIHLHLVQFQVLNRQVFDLARYDAAYSAAFPARTEEGCTSSGVFCPGSGPPLDYDNEDGVVLPKRVPGVGGDPLTVLGGNPDVTPFLNSRVELPAPYETGWKDTVQAPSGKVTRLVVRWAPTDLAVATAPELLAYPFDPTDGPGYVWHCHIIDHEDNEMMRPTKVQAGAAATRSFVLP